MPEAVNPFLVETWSPEARVAAILARRKKEHGERVTPRDRLGQDGVSLEAYFRHHVRKLKHGQSMAVPLPEGQLQITRRTREGALSEPLRDYHVSGGGSHPDPESRRGPRNLVGSHAIATEAAERVRNMIEADKAHSRQLTTQVRSSHGPTKIVALTGHAAVVKKTPKGTFLVHHDSEDLKDSEHATPEDAVKHAKQVLRHQGARFLDEGHDTDPLSTLPSTKRAVVQTRAERFTPDRVKSFKEKSLDTVNPEHSGGTTDVLPDLTGAVLTHSELAPRVAADHLSQSHLAAGKLSASLGSGSGHVAMVHAVHIAHHGVYVHHVVSMFQSEDSSLLDHWA